MRDGDIDDVLKRAANATPPVEPALLHRITQSIGASLAPVRPLPARWVLTSAATAGCLAVAIAGAVILGLHGAKLLSPWQIAIIFPSFVFLVWFAAGRSTAEVVPGSAYSLPSWTLPVAVSFAMLAVFAASFRDTGTDQFVAQGLRCLIAGMLQAVPAALAVWLILRRGFSVNPRAAAIAQGTLAGLAGVFMLELHCSKFELPHVAVWHIAVVPVCVAVGILISLRRSK